MDRTTLRRLIRFLKAGAVISLGLGIVGVIVLTFTFQLIAAGALLGAVFFQFALAYVFAGVADVVLDSEDRLKRVQSELLHEATMRRRVSDLEAENAELAAIAEVALNQRDAAT